MLRDGLADLRIVRRGLGGPAERGLSELALAEPEVQDPGEPVGRGERRVRGDDRLELLERLPVLSLVRVDAREQHLRGGVVGVGLHALLADDHGLHEPAHGEVRLGQRAVRVGRGVRGERVLEGGKLRGAERFRGGGHVAGPV